MPDVTSLHAALNVLALVFLAAFAWAAGQSAWALLREELWRVIVIIIVVIVVIIVIFGVV